MDPPRCDLRRTLDGEPAVFACLHPRVHAPGQRVTAEVCGMCSRWREPVAQAERRPFPPPPLHRGPCRHLGAQVGLRPCAGCRGAVQVKVFACADPRHGETTLAGCAVCLDFVEALTLNNNLDARRTVDERSL